MQSLVSFVVYAYYWNRLTDGLFLEMGKRNYYATRES